ncbi:hypothetical protein, partial [Oscillibacter sp.]|uniref:hypothetical protein n=1 Tax=Oscillibacter sp. TaxID=1945593 RepID=UPI002D802ECA
RTEIAQFFYPALGNQPKIFAGAGNILTSVPACGKHKRNNSGASALLKFVDNADCGAVQTFF